jgi:hypothetical protein
MRFWIFLALLVVSFAASPSQAAICNASGSQRVTGFSASNWSCGSPGATDDYRINDATDYVVIDGDFPLTGAGKLTCQAGTLIINSPHTLNNPNMLRIEEPCDFRIQGQKIMQGRIKDEVTSYPGGDQVAFVADVDISDIDIATDFVVFLADDPPGMDAPVTQLHIGPGAPPKGWQRMSAEKFRWYDIAAINVSTRTITYEQDECIGAGGTRASCYTSLGAEAYAGNYLNLANSLIDIKSMTAEANGTVTKIVFEDDALLLADNDGIDQYVIWPEVASPTHDDCSGMRAKIIDTRNVATDDEVYVAGDTTRCPQAGASNVRITRGATRGDPFMVVRPVVIDGLTTGSVEWVGGSVKMEYARFIDHEASDNALLLPLSGQDAVFNIYEASASEAPDGANSYMRWIDFPRTRPLSGGENFYSVLQIISALSNGIGPRYNNEYIDLAGMKFEHLYFHDVLRASGNSNSAHIFYDMQGINKDFDNVRMERYGDDGIWGGTTIYADIDYENNYRGLVQMGQIPGTSASGEAIVLFSYGAGYGLANTYFNHEGKYNISDWFSSGSGDGNAEINGPNLILKRPVLVGNRSAGPCQDISDYTSWISSQSYHTGLQGSPSAGACVDLNDPDPCCDGLGAGGGLASGDCYLVDNMPYDYGAGIEDAIMWDRPACRPADPADSIKGIAINKIISSNLFLNLGEDNNQDYQIVDLTKMYESFVHIGAASNRTAPFLAHLEADHQARFGVQAQPWNHRPKQLEIWDSVFSTDAASFTLLTDQYDHAGETENLISADLRRSAFILFGYANAGPLDTDLEDLPAGSVSIDRVKFTEQNAGAAQTGAIGSSTNNGATVTMSCLKSTDDPKGAFGTSIGSGNTVALVMEPGPGNTAYPASFAGQGLVDGNCGEPRRIGLRTFGRSHMMLGDFVAEQLDRHSSDLRIHTSRSASEDVRGMSPNPR